MTCSNCGRGLAEHCRQHLVPCCPGRCPGADAGWYDASDARYAAFPAWAPGEHAEGERVMHDGEAWELRVPTSRDAPKRGGAWARVCVVCGAANPSLVNGACEHRRACEARVMLADGASVEAAAAHAQGR